METDTPPSLLTEAVLFSDAFSAAPATPWPSPRPLLESCAPPAELAARATCAVRTAAAAWALLALRSTPRPARRSSSMLRVRVCVTP